MRILFFSSQCYQFLLFPLVTISTEERASTETKRTLFFNVSLVIDKELGGRFGFPVPVESKARTNKSKKRSSTKTIIK